MAPVLTVDYTTKKVIVTTDAAIYVYDNRSAAYADFPELAPAAPTAAAEKKMAREQNRARLANGQDRNKWGQYR